VNPCADLCEGVNESESLRGSSFQESSRRIVANGETMLSDDAKQEAVRYVPNEGFTEAVVTFADGSTLTFHHSSRESRWAKASAEGSTADRICLSLRQFRLNAKHLQLFFTDGSDLEFFAPEPLV
jgi:hypothetical protein